MGFDGINEKNIVKTVFLRKIKDDNRICIRGYSMEPAFYEGDIVTVERCDVYDIGDVVIALDNPCRLLIHRIVDISSGKDGKKVYRLKGDNAELCENIPEKYCLARVVEKVIR